ncbi:unnamed protein product [Urochloa decumbens]|uniref:Cytosolic Fe-S cluster assembly factor NBP35 n=1 Tax=Urochloa decumbens TaxID=240449 RepID=A0ABC9D4E2_9POAL
MESSGGDGGGGGGGSNVPEDANDHKIHRLSCGASVSCGIPRPVDPLLIDFAFAADCPGTQSENAGKEEPCAGCPNQQVCATAPKGPDPDLPAISDRMSNVKHKILVMSGKGGVGKSTFSTQLSFALAEMDYEVGLFDIDLCGPSIPKMLGLEGQDIHQSNFGWQPVYVESNLGVMSIGFLLRNQDDAVAWMGPRKNGTSDENISIVKLLKSTGIDGAIIVTTPQQVSLIDVRKGINFCKMVGVPVLGVIENMSGLRQAISDMRFVKPSESGETDVTDWALEYIKEKAPDLLSVLACSEAFDSSKGGAEKMCHEMGVPFLGKVPMDPQLGKAVEEGRSCFNDQKCSASAPALKQIIEKLIKHSKTS